MKLIVGTESTWSLRAIICGYLSAADFEIEIIQLSEPNFKSEILKFSPTGLVPALITESATIHDSLAIAEFFNEIGYRSLYPQNKNDRAISRSLCAEVHSGFKNIRADCPFSMEKVEPVSILDSGTSLEVSRIEEIFSQASMPFMFDEPGIVDAFYAVLAYRLTIYGINFNGNAGSYQQSLIKWPMLLKAIEALHT
ncbi:MAG: glutathione S-transferase N-terminal domain-containing protein [Agarilytica sp.]